VNIISLGLIKRWVNYNFKIVKIKKYLIIEMKDNINKKC